MPTHLGLAVPDPGVMFPGPREQSNSGGGQQRKEGKVVPSKSFCPPEPPGASPHNPARDVVPSTVPLVHQFPLFFCPHLGLPSGEEAPEAQSGKERHVELCRKRHSRFRRDFRPSAPLKLGASLELRTSRPAQ